MRNDIGRHAAVLVALVGWGVPALGWACAQHATTAASRKLTAPLAERLASAHSRADRHQWVDCLVKVEGDAPADQSAALARAGFRERSAISSGSSGERILTGSVRVRDLQAVADLPFVVVVEGAVAVGPKAGMGLK